MNEKKSTFEIRVRLQSFNKSRIEVLKKRIKMFATNYNFLYSSINLPIDKKKITVLKSPHVNKKARDQFEVNISNCLVILKGLHFNLAIYQKLLEMESGEVLTKLTIYTRFDV